MYFQITIHLLDIYIDIDIIYFQIIPFFKNIGWLLLSLNYLQFII